MAMTKIRGLQLWCAKQVDGYRDVAVTDMTTSWKSGLAFCAIIHRYRPDLIDYDSLSKENVFENNDLAFNVAEKELGIPAFLEAADMVAIRVPDKLSVITYVSQYYNYFHDKPQLGGPGVKGAKAKAGGTKRHQDVDPKSAPESKRTNIREKTSNRGKSPDRKAGDKTSTLGDKCEMCDGKVYLLERHIENGKLYHRSCFRHSEMSPTSKVFQKSPYLSSTLTKNAGDKKPQTSTPVGRTAEKPASVASSRNLFEKNDKPGSKPSQADTNSRPSALAAKKAEDAKSAKSEGLFGPKKTEVKSSLDVLPSSRGNKVQDTSAEKNQRTAKSWLSDKSDPKLDVKSEDKKSALGSGLSSTSKQDSSDRTKTQESSADKPPSKSESSEGFLSNLMKTLSPPKDEKPKKSGLLEFLSGKKSEEEEKKTEEKKESSSVSAQIAKLDQAKPSQPSDSSSKGTRWERTAGSADTPKQTEVSIPVPKPRQTKSGDFSGQKPEEPKFAVPSVPKPAPRSSVAMEGKTEKKAPPHRPQVLPTAPVASPRGVPMEVDDDSAVTSPDSPPPLPASAPPPLVKLSTPRDASPPAFPASSPPSSARSGGSYPSSPSSVSSVLSGSSQSSGRSDSKSSTSKVPPLSPPRSGGKQSKPSDSAWPSSPPRSNLFGRKSPTKSILSTSPPKSGRSDTTAKSSGRATSPARSDKGADLKSSRSGGSEPITRPSMLEVAPPKQPHKQPGVSFTAQNRQETPMEVEEAMAHALSPSPSSPPVAVLVTPRGEGEDKRVLGSLLQSLANVRQASPRSPPTSSGAGGSSAQPPSRVEDVVLKRTGERAGAAEKSSPRPKSVPSVLSGKMSVLPGSSAGPDRTETSVTKAKLDGQRDTKAKSHENLGAAASKDSSDVPAWKKALEDRKAKKELERVEEKMETGNSNVVVKQNLKKEDGKKESDAKPVGSAGKDDGPSWIKNAENMTSRLRNIGTLSRDQEKAKSKPGEEADVKKPAVGDVGTKKQKVEKMEVDSEKEGSKFKSKPDKNGGVKVSENGVKSTLSTPLWNKTQNDKPPQNSVIGSSDKLRHNSGNNKDAKDKYGNNTKDLSVHVNTIPETPQWKQGILEKRGQPKAEVQTAVTEEVPDWQKALEERKARLERSRSEDGVKPRPMSTVEEPAPVEKRSGISSAQSKPSSTARPKSELPSKSSSDNEAGKLEWQREAERRMAALKSGFVDPEKAKLDKAAEKTSQDSGLARETAHPPSAGTKKEDRGALSSQDQVKHGHGPAPARPPPPETRSAKGSTAGGPPRPPPPDVKASRQLPSLDVVSAKQRLNGEAKPLTTPSRLESKAEEKSEEKTPRPKFDIFKTKDPVTPSSRVEPSKKKLEMENKSTKKEDKEESKPPAFLRENKLKEESPSSTTPTVKPRTGLNAEKVKPAKSRTTWYTETPELTEPSTGTETEETQRKQRVIPAPPESPPPTPPPRLRKIPLAIKFDFENSADLESSTDPEPPRGMTLPPQKPPRTMEYQGPLTPNQVDFSSPKAISPIKIQQTLTDIDHRLTELELRGRQLEDSIRNVESNEMEDDGLMVEWFKLVNEKNVLVRQEADLVYLSREQELLNEQDQVEGQLQYLVSIPEAELTKEMREEMNFLLQKKLDVINQRSCIVDSMDEDRLRYQQEDKEIDEILTQKGYSSSPEGKVIKGTKANDDNKKKKK